MCPPVREGSIAEKAQLTLTEKRTPPHAHTRSTPTHTTCARAHTCHTHTHTHPCVRQVTGEEEIPEGVVAVLTPDAPDVLSHVSVRARNMRVLFATCHDEEPLQQIKVIWGSI